MAETQTAAVVQLTPHQRNVKSLRTLAESPSYLNRFKQVLDNRAPQFVASLVQVVASSEYLAKCDPNTIMAAAITAAALDLPIDKNLGFAHIVPYGQDAQFQMGYKGFIQLAIRTGQYKFLNCCVVREGELVKYDELTGEIVLDPTKRASEKVIGYAAYFKLMNGYEHAEYWTREEMHAHAMQFSQAFKAGRNTPWKTNFDQMGLKTVIKSLLSHWGIMSIEMTRALTNDQSVRKTIDSDDVAYPDNEPKKPERDGPPEEEDDVNMGTNKPDPAAAKEGANVIDLAAAKKEPEVVIDKPFEHLLGLIKQSEGVTNDDVHRYMKANKLCGAQTEDLGQATESKLREVIAKWPNVVEAIKKLAAEKKG